MKAGRCLAAVFIAAMLPCGCGRVLSPALPAPAEPAEPAISELRTRVDNLLASRDSVTIRHGVADVFALADRLLAAGQQDDAMRYLSAGLKHNAWALDYQMRYAEIAGQRGEPEVAGEKAGLVREHTERDDLFVRAQKVLGQPPLPPVLPMQEIQDNTTTLVLVPVGPADRCVLNDLSQDLGRFLRVPVIVRDAGVRLPEYARDPVAVYLANIRTNLIHEMKTDIRLALFFKRKGINEATLRADEGVITACRHLSFQSGGTNALARFDAGLRDLRKVPRQWDMDKMLQSLQAAVQPYLTRSTCFIGVANLDAFAGQSNYLFGTAQNNGHHGMIAYRRFTAEFNRENESRRRLVDRALKQVLSSFGFMLGVQRCSTPTCARAYPHNLAEHDAKSSRLCPACRAGFEQALGVTLEASE